MFRRRTVSALTTATGVASLGSPSAVNTSSRHVTSRGQFNPLHDFASSVADPTRRAQNAKEFEKMITNPGPIRVGYSSDYLDWLYRAYKSKMKYADTRAKAEKVFAGALFTQQSSLSASGGAGMSERERAAIASLPGAPPPGMFVRPSHSSRRLAGEHKRSSAQKTLDKVAQAQGWLDLFERQPQFPTVHIDKASRFHIVELFKTLVLDRALEPNEVWDKALLYRAILTERKASYPNTFKYIFESVEDTVLAPSAVEAEATTVGSGGDTKGLATRCPSEDDYRYFLFLVKRYYVDNAVEGHVVLRCHRAPNAQDLLFSNPPPKDESEVKRAIFASAPSSSDQAAAAGEGKAGSSPQSGAAKGVIRPPTQYPPIEALWRCEENVPLLKVLVFGELNLLVSENPFAKFPNAQAFLTRPSAAAAAPGTDTSSAAGRQSQAQPHQRGGQQRRGQSDGISLASLIGERRGHLVAPLPRHVGIALDSRANDLRRLQQRHQREDAAGFQQKVLRGPDAEKAPVMFSSYSDWTYFNPRAVRAETRDALHREAIDALKQYDGASKDVYRCGYEAVELDNTMRPTEADGTFPTYVPTLPHFLAQVRKDSHIAFLQHVGLPSHSEMKHTLDHLTRQLASALHKTALEYTNEALRRANHQKVQVAASLLDRFVATEWRNVLDRTDATTATTHGSSVAGMARRLGSYAPFETRALDEAGFVTSARMEDYQRWMRASPAQVSAR